MDRTQCISPLPQFPDSSFLIPSISSLRRLRCSVDSPLLRVNRNPLWRSLQSQPCALPVALGQEAFCQPIQISIPGSNSVPAVHCRLRLIRANPASRNRRCAREHLRAIYSPARSDDAAHGRHRNCRRNRLPGASGFAAAASRFPHHLGIGRLAWRKSGDHGVFGRHAAGTTTRTYRGRQ